MQLNEMFRSILTAFRDMSGSQWDATKAQFPPVIRERLEERYGL
jgi:transportin-1